MHGPYWNDNTGVTGEPREEPKFRTQEPDYVTVLLPDESRFTFVGEKANAIKAVMNS